MRRRRRCRVALVTFTCTRKSDGKRIQSDGGSSCSIGFCSASQGRSHQPGLLSLPNVLKLQSGRDTGTPMVLT
jgi:hypothetical protein